jgi:hypothetical protein
MFSYAYFRVHFCIQSGVQPDEQPDESGVEGVDLVSRVRDSL